MTTFNLSVRQIIVIALLSALVAAGAVAVIVRFSDRFQPRSTALIETPPEGVTSPALSTEEQNNIEVYKAIAPGVAFVSSTTYERDFFGIQERPGAGSGSVIDDQGHVLTNNHVVEGAQKLSVSFGGDRAYSATVIGRDPDTDLAVIKVSAPSDQLKIVPIGDSDKLQVGQKVLAIGNPFGFDRTLTTGVISGLQRPIRARTGRLIEGAIQTDASINPGNSGGPLLDSQGRMIGINSQIISPTGGSVGVGFAIPANIAKRVIPQLIQQGRVVRPKLGITTRAVRDLRDQVRLPVSEGLIIMQVAPGGAAAAAGLRGLSQTPDGDIVIGDIITSVDGQAVNDADDLFRILDKHKVGDVINVEIFRNNRKISVPVTLAELPEVTTPIRR